PSRVPGQRVDTVVVIKPTPPAYKSPGIATMAGLILPGGGQMYAGKPEEGIALLFMATASITGGVLMSDPGYVDNKGDVVGQRTYPLVIGTGLYALCWAGGWMTAGYEAHRHNVATGAKAVSLQRGPHSTTQIGLTFRVR